MLSCKRSRFTISPQKAYLNCAYMAPLLKASEKAGIKGVRLKRDPTSVTPEHFFQENVLLRQEFGKLINSSTERISIIPSVSYGMATVCRNIRLRADQHIIVAAEQFPSNYYAWKKLCDEAGATLKVISPSEARVNRGKEWNERILDAISNETKAVAIGHVHWADGTKFDLEKIREKTNQYGALLIIDGTQSVGALPFDVRAIKPDALIVAGYKWLLGPYSIGLAYYGENFDKGNPIEENWINRRNSENFAGLVNYESDYKAGASRYDVGEHSNFILVPMLRKALQQLNKWKPENIQEYCSQITAEAIRILRENEFWVEDENFRSSHLFGVRLPAGKSLDQIKADLQKRKIFVSFRGDAIRVSPNVYNKESELLRFAKTLIGS